ncbi:MAG: hypothetical protein FWE33_01555 [Defluviitaleaceae bacterium]|nr:hypothetical protein [Defluviitaleaceae bacterium]
MKNKLRFLLLAIIAIAGLMIFAACDGPNGSSWRSVSGLNERTFEDGFSISLNAASSGHRNRTFELDEHDLETIHIHSSNTQGEVILTISANGELDGSEIVIDMSNGGNFDIDASGLGSGRIRFSLSFENTRNSSVDIVWGEHGHAH